MSENVLKEVRKNYAKMLMQDDQRVPQSGYWLLIDMQEHWFNLHAVPVEQNLFKPLSDALMNQTGELKDLVPDSLRAERLAGDPTAPFDIEITFENPVRIFCGCYQESNVFFKYPFMTLRNDSAKLQFRREFKNIFPRNDMKMISFDVIPFDKETRAYDLDLELVTGEERDGKLMMNPFTIGTGIWVNSPI